MTPKRRIESDERAHGSAADARSPRPGGWRSISAAVVLTLVAVLIGGTAVGFVSWGGQGPHINLTRSSFQVHQNTPSNFPGTPGLVVTTVGGAVPNVNGSSFADTVAGGVFCAAVDGGPGGKCTVSAFALEFTLVRNATLVQAGNNYLNVSLTFINGTKGQTENAQITVVLQEIKGNTAGATDSFYLVWNVQPQEIDNLILNIAGT
jgi:hypothetical protein